MRIAFIGTRGVPANYSGFETCVEQLGQRLYARGHDVTVYCRTNHVTYPGRVYKGMQLVKLPTIPNKYLDTIFHSFISSIHALSQNYDIALYFIAGNSPVAWIPRIVGTETLLNVDGLDWKREKWPRLAKIYLQFAEYLATILPDAFLTDSRVIQGYYRDRFGIEPPYIPYGSEIDLRPPGRTLQRFALEPQRYILHVGRLVPENCAHHIVEAFRRLDTNLKCVIVGDAQYAEAYQDYLRQLAADDPRIIFTGYIFGEGYHELGTNAYVFVESSAVGGTHPAIVEAMAFGNCVVVNDTPENIETIGEAGLTYVGQDGGDSLRLVLEKLLSDDTLVQEFRQRARRRANSQFSWEAVTDAYETLFYQLIGRPLPDRLARLIP